MKIDKEYFDIKIDREYYEKLKRIDYSKVEKTLYDTFKDYGIWLLEDYIQECEEKDIIYKKFLNGEYDDDLIFPPSPPPKNYEEEKKFLESGKYFYSDIELVMIVVAYILMILQEPSLNKKFSLFSIEKDYSILPSKIDEIMYKYIFEDRFKYYISPLINKFDKDELLSFIVFSFGFKHYLNNKLLYSNNLFNPLSDGLLKLFLKILDIKDNDEVLNLYSGLGDFLIESFLNNPNITIYGKDYYYNHDISILKTSLFSDDIKFENFKDKFGNSINIFEYFKDRGKNKQKIDKIFLNLSIISYYYKKNKEEVTIGYRNIIKNEFNFQDELIKEVSLEWLFHILVINHLKGNSKAISLVDRNILSDPNNKNIREFFVENGYIKSIVLLPENILTDFHTSLVLIVFSKGNKKIKFVNASNLYKNEKIKSDSQKDVAILTEHNVNKILNLLNNDKNNELSISKKNEDFLKNNYNLDVVKNINTLTEFKNSIEFKNVIKNIIRGSQISTSELNKIKSIDTTPYIYLTLSNINDGIIEFENIENYLKEIPEKQEKFCVKNNSFLLSKIGKAPYKFVVTQIFDNKKVLVSGNFVIIEVDEKRLNPWYLAAFFTTPLGEKTLKKAYIGTLHSSLSIKKLEKIEIPLLSMEEQNKIGQKYFKTINKIKEIKKNLKDKIKSTKEIFYEI